MNYISILRGINVSGQKKVKMDDLKLLYESLGLKNIKTYIQSGNVIFTSRVKNIKDLKIKIEKAIQKKYNFHVPVQVRTSDELSSIINNYPFGVVDIEKEGTKILVTFLDSRPFPDKVLAIQKFITLPEKLIVKKDVVYLFCPNGYGKSKLSNNFIESKLERSATTRNWKSVCKLFELSQ
ncbi:DUF1697 domain-containing protein [bacterium]|jgi:uncharacterized protein (DUF1697 family)|nr:DUF1697 domain-containing protein [bacterium]